MNCEFCKQIFKNKYSLKTHQENAKYCLELRNAANDNFICEYCNKKLSSKQILENHYQKCTSKKINIEKDIEIQKIINKYTSEIEILKHFVSSRDSIIDEQKETINNLQNQIKELASLAIDKPSTINHNLNNNSNNKMIDNRTLNMVPFNLTEDKIMKVMKDKFEEKHLMRGQEGLADFFVENILVTTDKKFLYRCTDASRNHFIYVDENGKIQKDINGHHLIQLINEPVRQRTREIYQECSDRYFDNAVYDDENNDGTDTTEDDRLTFIGDKVVEITGLKNNNNKFLNRLKAPIIVNK